MRFERWRWPIPLEPRVPLSASDDVLQAKEQRPSGGGAQWGPSKASLTIVSRPSHSCFPVKQIAGPCDDTVVWQVIQCGFI